MEQPIDTAILDALIATPEGRTLIQERWQYATDAAIAKAKDDRKALQEARKASPEPLTGWDCWVCGWKGEQPNPIIGGCNCPRCTCLHGLRCAPGAWSPHRY